MNQEILTEYLKLLNLEQINKLAFDVSDSEIFVWAEINDDDDNTSKNLILAEAKINALYNINMTTTIVEFSNNLSIPSYCKQYK